MKSRYPARIGRYEVIDRLGVGGMGAVYLASDPLLGRTVAVKILHTDDDELRQRFEREARSAASLRHQHIVTIYDIGDDEGGPFLAMEFLDGETMAELIRRRSPLSIDVRLELMSQLCSGLGYAHRKGIIHRDIKPANLMITSEGVLKIVDFGLARVTAGASMTRSGMLMGTPHYMSPEQVEGTAVDHLSDIFSVGVVLYELISYRKAYPGDSTAAILHNILHGAPAPISASVGELDPELEVVVARAIERPKERRYQDLRELGADLDRIRMRLKAISEGATVVVDRSAIEFGTRPRTPEAEETGGTPSMKPSASDAGRTPRSDAGRTPTSEAGRAPRRNLDAITQKRAAQIAKHLAAASEHIEADRLEAAIEECEHVLVLDPNDARALQLLERAHEALDERQVSRWVGEARVEMSHGAFTRAEQLVEQALKVRSQSTEARALQQQIRDTRRERERAADRARAVNAAVERARRNLQEGAFEAAARAAAEALGYDPAHQEAAALRDAAAAALDEWRREQALHKAQEAAARAREQADAGNHSEALAALRAFAPPHPVVNDAIAEIDARVRALEQERREEEERARQRALEEARRQERLAALRRDAKTAIERGDWNRARAAARAARESFAGDEELEQLCRDIETESNAAEAAARLQASARRHVQVAEAALARGDLPVAVKSAAAAVNLMPEDAEVLRLQQAVKEQLARAEAARQLLLREQVERERLEHERVEREQLEREQLERERLERERVERQRLDQERPLHERQEQERLEQERQEAARLARVRALEEERLKEEKRARQQALEEARRQEQLVALQRTAQAAIERADWKGSRAAVRTARKSLPGDEEVERLCRAIEADTTAAETAARSRASAQRHLRAAEAALVRGDLTAAAKSADAAASLTPEDSEVVQLKQAVKEQLARAEAARQLLLREQTERERLERERIERARLERERLERERLERERVERERLEQERLLQERQEQERLKQERLEAARLARERQDQERLEREREREERRSRERQERERAAEKYREADVHAALARDRQLAADARARASALRLSAAEEQRARELRSSEAAVQPSDSPPAEIETPPVLDQPTPDDAPAAVTRVARITEIQPGLTVARDVPVRRAEPRWSRRLVAGVIAAAAVIVVAIGIFWPREPASEIQQEAPPQPRVDYAATLRQGVDAYHRGDVAAAIRTALSIPESAGERQQALEFLQTIRRDAAAQAAAERRAAETTGKAGDVAFLGAVTKQQEAERATNPADTDRVVSLFAEATRLYRQAAETGLSTMDLLQTARRELQANRITGAIDYALQALTLAPDDEAAVAFLRSIRAQAERQAQAAAAAAKRAGASGDNSPAFREAVALENTGRAVTEVRETQRAHDAFAKARERYSAAAAQLRDATQRAAEQWRAAIERVEERLKANDVVGATAALQEAEQLNASDPAVDSLRKRVAELRASAEAGSRRETQIRQILDAAERESNDNNALKALQSALTQFPGESRIEAAINGRRRARDLRITELIRRARASSGNEAVQLLEQALALDPSRSDVRAERDSRKGSGVNTRQLERDVRDLIEKVKDAYESRDVNDVLRVAPNASRSLLEAQLKPFSRVRVAMEPYTVTLTPDGTGASVTCVVKATRQPAGISARPLTDTRTWQFQLRNVDGTWRITAAQF